MISRIKCFLLGHDFVTLQQAEVRKFKYDFSRKGGRKHRQIRVVRYYHVCTRCGKVTKSHKQ